MVKQSRRHKVTILVASIVLIAVATTYLTANAKYYDPSFRSYVKGRQHCDAFWGGSHESKEQMYQDWKQSHGVIGC